MTATNTETTPVASGKFDATRFNVYVPKRGRSSSDFDDTQMMATINKQGQVRLSTAAVKKLIGRGDVPEKIVTAYDNINRAPAFTKMSDQFTAGLRIVENTNGGYNVNAKTVVKEHGIEAGNYTVQVQDGWLIMARANPTS